MARTRSASAFASVSSPERNGSGRSPDASSSGVVDPLGIRFTDQMGRSSTAILSVHITGPNDVRQIVISRPADEFVYVGSPWIYVITVDSSLLSPTSQSNQFSLPIAPFGTTITQLTGNQAQIRFQPTTGQVGINHLAIKCVDQVSHACCLQQIPIVVLNGAPQ